MECGWLPGDRWLEKCSLSLRNCNCAWQQDAVAGSAHWWSGSRSDLTVSCSKGENLQSLPVTVSGFRVRFAVIGSTGHSQQLRGHKKLRPRAMQVLYSQPHCCSSGKTGTCSAEPSRGLRLSCNVQFSAFPLQAVSLSFLSRGKNLATSGQ